MIENLNKEKINYHVLTVEDFAKSFDIEVSDMPPKCLDLISQKDFRYKILEGNERDALIIEILRKIDNDKKVVGAPERHEVWEKGWTENLSDFVKSGFDLDQIVPKFFRDNQAFKVGPNYVIPANPNFERDFFDVFRLWLYDTYLKDYNPIYDFGCGTGLNLIALAKLYPEKKLYGLDFCRSSVELVNKIAEVYKLNMNGHYFDLTTPDENIRPDKNSAIITFGSIEQLPNTGFWPFLHYLLKYAPGICINMEPVIDFYDENKLPDFLSIKFHQKRRYPEKLLPALKRLEQCGEIEILKAKRQIVGTIFSYGYDVIIWRPLR